MVKLIWTSILSLLVIGSVLAQTADITILVQEEHDKEALIGATVFFPDLSKGTVTDVEGLARLTEIPLGEHHIELSFIGFETIHTDIFVDAQTTSFTFLLEEQEEELEEIVVRAARSSRTIQNLPTRVEFIGSEELGEKAIMNAANISLVLRESTGIQVQQTSLSSGNMSIRIQGLDGRYTQLLKDGFPLYGGFAGGLSIMQIPPLDLQQFEIIKGSSSTLYGGGAIAGLVNMVAKTPEAAAELDIMLSQTHALGSTANVFYSQRKGKIGYTLYGSAHRQEAYDPDGDDYSNLPETRAISFNPKLFYYPSDKSQLWVGLNATYDQRQGGDMTIINDAANGVHQYSDENTSLRFNSQAVYDYQFGDEQQLQIKNSVSFFDRSLSTPTVNFTGQQWNTFSEASYTPNRDWIVGMNLYSNRFEEESNSPRNQEDITLGAFANNTTKLSETLTLESGFRLDYSPDWGVFPLPRLALLWKANKQFSTRVGGGLGYKIPDLFTEEASTLNFANIQAINKEVLDAERSYGLNFDMNYKTVIKDILGVSINQLFYLTSIDNALLLNGSDSQYEFANAAQNVLSRGAETNIKFSYQDFRWFLNYAYINATLNYLPNNPQKPLTPRHNAGTVLMYENEAWRIGYEAYYTGSQLLSTGERTTDFVTMGFLFQKHFEWGSPYINFENFTDQRQSKFSPEVLPPHDMPVFTEIYAPTDGFIFTIGVLIKPFGNHHHAH